MSEASWQEILRQRLVERNTRDAAFAPIIEQCPSLSIRTIWALAELVLVKKMAQQTKLLKERNATLLKAVGSVRSNPNSSTVFVPGKDE